MNTDSAKTTRQGESLPPGPAKGMKITEEYARLVTRNAYFWAWPLVNIYNRRISSAQLPEIVMAGSILASPVNRLGMQTDYIAWDERLVACPNQDVAYGGCSLALDQSPVVIQAPDFGNRFWVYPAYDLRTDQFTAIGSIYGSKPGFYLLVGPDWQGETPKGINQVFRAKTNTGFIVARVFLDDTPEDKKAILDVVSQITLYPLSEFDGTMKVHDWTQVTKVPAISAGDEEQKWVIPEKFCDVLPLVLADSKPLPGEEAQYAQVAAVLDAAKADPQLRRAMDEAAGEADKELVQPLLQFRNWGLQLPHHWSTIDNNAAFGTDYFSRTAAAKANIFVNKPNETKYFYQDLDSEGGRLNGSGRYAVTFQKGQTPPVGGFWSLTLYNEYHFFAPNAINRFSLGTKNKDLKTNDDGSLTLYVQADEPVDPALRSNWLPAPKADFSLYLRAYGPKEAITDRSWTPPPVTRQ